jgi:hypothetical protein
MSLAILLNAPDMLVLKAVYLTNVRGLSDVFHGVETEGCQCVEVCNLRDTYMCYFAVCYVV